MAALAGALKVLAVSPHSPLTHAPCAADPSARTPGALPQTPTVLRYLFRSAATLADAIAYADKYAPLLHPGLRCALDVVGNRGVWSWHVVDGAAALPCPFTAVLAHYAQPELWAGRVPDELDAHDPELARDHAECGVGVLVFTRRSLRARGVQADAALVPLLLRVADQDLERVGVGESHAERVRALLKENAADPLDLETLARRLAMSSRTLRRRLDEEGTSYSALLEESRKLRAHELLRERRRSICEVAELLGYAEPNAFARAFRRWYGAAPTAHRRRVARARPELQAAR